MTTDKRADEVFKKKYFLNDEQVKVMQSTFNYQCLVLSLIFKDLWQAIKQEFRK